MPRTSIEWSSLPSRPEQLRVLVVDDDEDDFLIARDLLSEASDEAYTVEWAEDAEAAYERLAVSCYDVCLLDYRLRRANGLDVLTQLRCDGHRLPVILLTGQDDRNVDEEAVRRGASDYLIKGKIDSALLERSIRYALRQNRTEDALRRQGDFVSAVLDTAGALVIVVDTSGCIVRFNPACERLSGWTQAEMLGQAAARLIPGDHLPQVVTVAERLLAGAPLVQNESDWVTRTGERRRIEWSNATLRDQDGNVEYIVGTGIDVAERRRAEAALTRAREQEISLGATVQRTLLFRPPPSRLPGVTVGAVSHAAQRVGGDYADFFVYNNCCFDLLVGDVMGKGVAAALLSAATKSQFQRAVRRLGYDLTDFDRLPEPDEIVTTVHASVTRELMDMNSFVTLSYARLDRENSRLTLVDCGHPRPLHFSAATGRWKAIEGENIPLGMSEKETYRQTVVPVAPGDILFFYTDGITEAGNNADDLFGEERLLATLETIADRAPQEIVEAVCAAANRFRGEGGSEPDDMTAIALRVEAWNPAPRLAVQFLEVTSDPDYLEDLRQWVEAFVTTYGNGILNDNQGDGIVLALNEAIANIMRHAYQGWSGGRVRLQAEAFPDRLVWSIWDNGKPFEGGTRIPPPVFDGSRDGGFGLFMMKSMLDKIEYLRDDLGRNRLIVTRELGGEVPRGEVVFASG